MFHTKHDVSRGVTFLDQAEGRRRYSRHDPDICCKCLSEPVRAPGQRYGKDCHRLAQIDFRARKKAKDERNAVIAAGVTALLDQNTTLSKGKGNEEAGSAAGRTTSAADEDQSTGH